MAQRTAIDQMFAFSLVVHDPRHQHPTMLHTLETILTIRILATTWGSRIQWKSPNGGRPSGSGSRSF
jgi:hypothetical protein